MSICEACGRWHLDDVEETKMEISRLYPKMSVTEDKTMKRQIKYQYTPSPADLVVGAALLHFSLFIEHKVKADPTGSFWKRMLEENKRHLAMAAQVGAAVSEEKKLEMAQRVETIIAEYRRKQ